MITEKRMKTLFGVSIGATAIATVLATIALFTEFDSSIGYFARSAPLHTTYIAVMIVGIIAVIAGVVTMKKRELYPIINYSSSPFRFFASMSACLSLLCAYVRFQTYRVNISSDNPLVLRGNIYTALAALFSMLSFLVFITYCFGKNEARSGGRAVFGIVAVAMLVLRLMETHFSGNIPMNNPIKLSLQFTYSITVFALLYTLRCEFPINEAKPFGRTVFMLICPIFALTFAIPTIIGYYAKIYTNFEYLVDALLLLSVCGFVLTAYVPCRKAKPVCDSEWEEYDIKLAEYKLQKELEKAQKDTAEVTECDVEIASNVEDKESAQEQSKTEEDDRNRID